MSIKNNRKHLRHHRRKQPWPMLILFSVGLLLVIGAVVALRKPPEPKAAIEVTGYPSLKVDREKVDLGDVPLGQTVEVKFRLMNVGDQPLHFSKAPYIEVLEGC